jgi:hypothetical protein
VLDLVPFTPGESVPFKVTFEADELGLLISTLNGYDFWFSDQPENPLLAGARLRLSTIPLDSRDGEMLFAGRVLWWEIPPAVTRTLTTPTPFYLKARTPTGRLAVLRRGTLKPFPQTTPAA